MFQYHCEVLLAELLLIVHINCQANDARTKINSLQRIVVLMAAGAPMPWHSTERAWGSALNARGSRCTSQLPTGRDVFRQLQTVEFIQYNKGNQDTICDFH